MEKQPIRLPDGRKAEKVISTDGEKTTTEIYAEPQVQKILSSRVTEYTKPVVVKRETDLIDSTTGAVLERKIESVDSPALQPVQVVRYVDAPAEAPAAEKVSALAMMPAQASDQPGGTWEANWMHLAIGLGGLIWVYVIFM